MPTLKACFDTLLAACDSTIMVTIRTPTPVPADPPRAVWDNGTDYDIPTYLRRGGGPQRSASGNPVAPPPAGLAVRHAA